MELSFVTGRVGGVVGQNFLVWSKAEAVFSVGQSGDQNFFTYAKRGPKKLATSHHKQMAPLPLKNDSSLNKLPCDGGNLFWQWVL